MARKKQKSERETPKTTAEWEALSSDDVMATIFGKQAQETLKHQALTNDPEPKTEPSSP